MNPEEVRVRPLRCGSFRFRKMLAANRFAFAAELAKNGQVVSAVRDLQEANRNCWSRDHLCSRLPQLDCRGRREKNTPVALTEEKGTGRFALAP
jgi:hypothetical protein